VARAIHSAYRTNPAILPVAPEAHVGYWAKRVAPRALALLARVVDGRIDRE
jgi:hypothetical protein